MIFATGHDVEPWMSVYPDSDKISGPEGILLRSSAVGYWHGEGTAVSPQLGKVVRELGLSPARPTANVQPRNGHAKIGPLLGGTRLDATVVEVDPGEGAEPYHHAYGREEWLLVLAGAPSLRHPQGQDDLETGDLVCFPEGPAGARSLFNQSESVVHALLLSTTGLPANVYYPDTGHWLIRNGLGPDDVACCEIPDNARP